MLCSMYCPLCEMVGLMYCHLLLSWYSRVEGVRCSSVVRAFAHGAMGRRIDPSRAISRSSQFSTTGVTKAVVCAILSVGWCI